MILINLYVQGYHFQNCGFYDFYLEFTSLGEQILKSDNGFQETFHNALVSLVVSIFEEAEFQN